MTATKKKRGTTKKADKVDVVVNCVAPEAEKLFIVGSFNQWSEKQTPMSRDENGLWSVTLCLPRGRHEYRFYAAGYWFSDHQACEAAPNPHGSHNSILVV